MRTFLTIGIPRNQGKPEILVGPDKARNEHVDEFRKFQARRASGQFSEVQLWGSSEGIQKRLRLSDIKAEATTKAPPTQPTKLESKGKQ